MDIINSISDIVGPKGLLLGNDVSARPNSSWGVGNCPAKAIVRPASTQEMSRVMALCHEHGQSVVPWGGLSGLVDGITCSADDIAISLERMNTIEDVDSDAGTMTVQAGTILQSAQEAAKEAGWMFAVDLGARGSANIGGMISTNAGGMEAFRNGTMRQRVLGLRAVLPNGTLLNDLAQVRKCNEGYDIKQLLIGADAPSA